MGSHAAQHAELKNTDALLTDINATTERLIDEISTIYLGDAGMPTDIEDTLGELLGDVATMLEKSRSLQGRVRYLLNKNER